MLRKFLAPEIVFGGGARQLAGRYARSFHAGKALLVTDPGVVAAGWAGQVEASLVDSGMELVRFDQISANPRMAQVHAGAALYRQHGCALIVAVGGGSPMDCAKGIGIVASNGGTIKDYEGVDRINTPVPPLIFIPTTAGTSADVSQFAIINDEQGRYKFAIISKAIVPDVALVDPETIASVPAFLAACTGMDALVHAIEAYVSTGAGPLTDPLALDAIRLVREHLPAVIDGGGGSAGRDHVMEASLKAGLAFSNAILGAVHAMAHSLGGFLDLPHGECNALLLPHVVRFNFPAAPERYREIAAALGLPVRDLAPPDIQTGLVEFLLDFRRSLGISGGLGERGVRPQDIPTLAQKAAQDPCMLTNPRPATADELAALFQEAL